MPHTAIVRILDKDYQVSCPPEQEPALLEAARHLDRQMRAIRETGKVIGLERIAVMAALNTTHELLQQRAESRLSADGQEQLRRLNDRVDDALQRFRQLDIG